jgi:hypothetical protein
MDLPDFVVRRLLAKFQPQGERHGYSVGAENEESSSMSPIQPFLDSPILYGTDNVKRKLFFEKSVCTHILNNYKCLFYYHPGIYYAT